MFFIVAAAVGRFALQGAIIAAIGGGVKIAHTSIKTFCKAQDLRGEYEEEQARLKQ